MKKSVILFISIAVSLLLFTLLAKVFRGVSHSLADRIYPKDYLQPTPKDSAYMLVLQDSLLRPSAMTLSNELRPFYITADSIRSILRADLSPELLSDIIISKGFARDLHSQLHRFDEDSIIPCPSDCLDSTFVENKHEWEQQFSSADKKGIATFVETYIKRVEDGELAALRKMLLQK